MTDHFNAITENVQRQYEKYPYPDDDPDWDRPQLLVSGHLGLMCDVIWAGQRAPEDLKVLDAGCGTGSAMVAMAMNYPNTEIVGVDFSQASLDKARRLIDQYNVKNIRLVHLPIERLPELGRRFDFVSASGVLHHLADPAAGLKAIGDVLNPQGAVSIMLYGTYGRTGIYMLQDAMRLIRESEPDSNASADFSPEWIRFTHRLAQHVPPWHPMSARSRGREMQEGKDAGIVDLLLHANDIPFDVPSVYRMCETAGMRFHRWLFPLIYNLETFFNDPFLLNRMTKIRMSRQQQEETAELAHGRNSKHSFIAVGPEFSAPQFSLSNGNWRNLHAKLTGCMAWNRIAPVQGKPDTFAVPFTIVQDAWGPLEINRWELMFLSRIRPDITLKDVLIHPAVQNGMPFKKENDVNAAVEHLLTKTLDRLALVFLSNP
ncbi:MAG: class I SAM-dependent methyltransferase [Candidatus Omnitrophota bacterium]